VSAAYKAYLLTDALKIQRSAGALSQGRAVTQTKGEREIMMNANNVWADSTAREEVAGAVCVFLLLPLFF